MIENKWFSKFSILVFLVIFILISGCIQSNDTGNTIQNQDDTTDDTEPEQYNKSDTADSSSVSLAVSNDIEKIEVYHFHGTNQCYSCKTVGAYAEETIETFFADELNSGKIVFDHINIDLPENQEFVKKYTATGSSLWIGTYTYSGKFSKEQNVNVWYKIDDKQKYLEYLKEVIEKKLLGDMN